MVEEVPKIRHEVLQVVIPLRDMADIDYAISTLQYLRKLMSEKEAKE